MFKLLLLAGAATAILSSTAVAAEYYILQEKSTKKCKVVDARPSESLGCRSGTSPSRHEMRPTNNARSCAK